MTRAINGPGNDPSVLDRAKQGIIEVCGGKFLARLRGFCSLSTKKVVSHHEIRGLSSCRPPHLFRRASLLTCDNRIVHHKKNHG